MTARAGGALVLTDFASSAAGGRKSRSAGGVVSSGGTAARYLNRGYYAVGAVWETWITTGSPSATPPSGHSLTFTSYVLIG